MNVYSEAAVSPAGLMYTTVVHYIDVEKVLKNYYLMVLLIRCHQFQSENLVRD